jgi:hypothetical protein
MDQMNLKTHNLINQKTKAPAQPFSTLKKHIGVFEDGAGTR